MNKYDMIERLKDWLEQVRILYDFVDKVEGVFGRNINFLEDLLLMSDYYTDTLEELITGKDEGILAEYLYERGLLRGDIDIYELVDRLIKQREINE